MIPGCRNRGICLRLLLATSLWLGWAAGAQGGSGTILSLPSAGKAAPSGFSLVVDNTWPEVTGGYRPVQISVSSTPAAVADHAFVFRITAQDAQNNDLISVVKELDFPAGASSGSLTISVPNFSHFQSYSLDVTLDGRHTPELSETGIPWAMNFDAGLLRILFVGDGGLDVSAVPSGTPQSTVPQYNQPASLLGLPTRPPNPLRSSSEPSFEHRMGGSLPGGWINYSGLDVVCVSLKDVERMASSNPAAWDAVREWTAAGGSLWVYGMGAEGSNFAELAKHLNLATSVKQPDESLIRETFFSPALPAPEAGTALPVDGPAEAPLPDEVEKTDLPTLVTRHVLWRPYKLGVLILIEAADPFPGVPEDWNCILAPLQSARQSLWEQRVGLSNTHPNEHFWNFLIPGVGLAPVITFRVLITVFVLAVGPLNYFFLRRWRRLHLLLFTVPLGAALITGCLVLYAVLADGFSLRVRARSFTERDERSGSAVCWSRQSYYAGLAPADGLKFSTSSAVLPLERWPVGGVRRARQALWNGEQHLASGWLASRTPTQFLIVTVGNESGGLKFETVKGAGLQVHNGLNTRIRQLMLLDKDRKFFVGEDIAAGATIELRNIDEGSLQHDPAVKRMLAEMRPQLTTDPSMQIDSQQGGRLFRTRRYASYSPQLSQGSGGRLEALLNQHIAWLEYPTDMPSQTYIAMVDRAPQVDFGTERAQEESSLHVLSGSW